jgi:hypothetical protein
MKCKCGGTFEPLPGGSEDEIFCNDCNSASTALVEFVGLCGCGDQEGLRALVLDALMHAKSLSCGDWTRAGEEIAREFVLHILNDKKILEHGTSVFCSWLTKTGEDLLDHLKGLRTVRR